VAPSDRILEHATQYVAEEFMRLEEACHRL
jgi:hypothetical protein